MTTTTNTDTVNLKRLGTKETAARIRTDIKNLQKHKLLPAGKFSVTMDRFAGGSSIDVRAVDVEATMFNVNRFAAEKRDPRAYRHDEPRMTAEGERILALMNKVVGAYHEDKSDIMSDYFNVNFYAHVDARGQEDKERAAFDAAMAEVAVVEVEAAPVPVLTLVTEALAPVAAPLPTLDEVVAALRVLDNASTATAEQLERAIDVVEAVDDGTMTDAVIAMAA
jgi:hypothetical protein